VCGITGELHFYNKSVDFDLLKRRTNVMYHRGPNDEAYFLDESKKFGMGMRRLSIIDLKKGLYPLHNEKKTLWLIFNGEIYNFEELQAELELYGHKFYTNTDAEVIIHAYEEWGPMCLDKFNGMWAICLWDSKKKELFLARDRFGIKPLYYYLDKNRLVFGSEIKTIIEDKSIKREPNKEIIEDYLIRGKVDCKEDTFFKGIKRLWHAHYVLIKRDCVFEPIRYWNCKANKKISSSKKDDYYARWFRTIFESSVKYRLISDVPIGTCLSGGLDSSSIVCIANKQVFGDGTIDKNPVSKKQKTFSAVYKGEACDEREYIEEILSYTGAEKNYTWPSSERLMLDLKKLIWHQEEPFGSTSIFAQWCVMNKVKERGVTVLLDGQGADELLAGYIPYVLKYLLELSKRGRLATLLKEFINSFDLIHSFVMTYILRILKKSKAGSLSSAGSKTEMNSSFSCFIYENFTRASLPQLLRYEDKNSMAFSIEARVPFLDYRLVEMAMSAPHGQRIKNGWTKYVLRQAMRYTLPAKIRLRRSKLGFETPEAKWLSDHLSKKVEMILDSDSFNSRGLFEPQKAKRLFRNMRCGKLSRTYARMLWRYINLELWLREFFDKRSGRP